MNLLAVVHGANVPPGVVGDEVERRGHRLDTWSLAWPTPPPLPVDDYDAVLIFGGSMHADQDDRHPWLREENLFLQRLLDMRVPMLGVCLGAQLIAKAAGAQMEALEEPEIGWVDVELTGEARSDDLLSSLPDRFSAFQWHYYGFGLPAGAQELARSSCCPQAFRLGDVAWGIQFHPEVTPSIVERWMTEDEADPPGGTDAFLAELERRAPAWEQVGRSLAVSFLEVAERERAAAAV